MDCNWWIIILVQVYPVAPFNEYIDNRHDYDSWEKYSFSQLYNAKSSAVFQV